MYIFGIQIPILELLVVFCIAVVIYLIVLEFEFRQQKKITKEFDDEEIKLSHEIRELKEAINKLESSGRVREERAREER